MADVNLVVYLLVPTPQTAVAERVLLRDRRWLVPHGFRLEFANAMRSFVRFRGMSPLEAKALIAKAREITRLGFAEPLAEEALIDVADRTGLTVYDAEYLHTAELLGIPLVTADKQIIEASPRIAVSPEDFSKGS